MSVLDSFGVPYFLSKGESFAGQDAVTLVGFEVPDGVTHSAAQSLALEWMRNNSGFDSVVKMVVRFGEGEKMLFLNVANGWWFEQ